MRAQPLEDFSGAVRTIELLRKQGEGKPLASMQVDAAQYSATSMSAEILRLHVALQWATKRIEELEVAQVSSARGATRVHVVHVLPSNTVINVWEDEGEARKFSNGCAAPTVVHSTTLYRKATT